MSRTFSRIEAGGERMRDARFSPVSEHFQLDQRVWKCPMKRHVLIVSGDWCLDWSAIPGMAWRAEHHRPGASERIKLYVDEDLDALRRQASQVDRYLARIVFDRGYPPA